MVVLWENKTDSVAASLFAATAAALVTSQFLMLLWKAIAGLRHSLFSLKGTGRGETNQERSGTEYSIKADLSKEIAAEIPTADKLASPRWQLNHSCAETVQHSAFVQIWRERAVACWEFVVICHPAAAGVWSLL